MKEFDLHGKTLKEAEDFFMRFVNQSRMNKKTVRVKFITGTGVIQARFIELCSELELEYMIPLANRGIIFVEFE